MSIEQPWFYAEHAENLYTDGYIDYQAIKCRIVEQIINNIPQVGFVAVSEALLAFAAPENIINCMITTKNSM